MAEGVARFRIRLFGLSLATLNQPAFLRFFGSACVVAGWQGRIGFEVVVHRQSSHWLHGKLFGTLSVFRTVRSGDCASTQSFWNGLYFFQIGSGFSKYAGPALGLNLP